MRPLPHPATEDIRLTDVLRALSDPVRLLIVHKLAETDELTCADAGLDLGLHKSTVSHHYRTLRDAGVILSKQEGRKIYLSLRRDDLEARFPGLLGSVLAAFRDSPPLAGFARPPSAPGGDLTGAAIAETV
ncbi:ArsR/SmtB family transcription factor [Nonomuraea indica]|uniref:ArsR/SmtB family transcription factor n=1 Tax=Nonomuraea indica TaxID=1581193 RepID=UPI000C7AA1A5|nr:helix-turn-helix transcriptional regulator [Nonomuraea indica]